MLTGKARTQTQPQFQTTIMSGEHSHSGDSRRAAASSSSSHATTWTLVVLAVPLLYVLSIGPVVALARNRTLPPRVVAGLTTFYAPLIWAGERPPLQQPLQAYVRWCVKMSGATP